MFENIKTNAVRTFNKGKLVLKKNAPEIWFWTGVGFGIGALVTAFKNGPKLRDAIENHNSTIESIHTRTDIPNEVKTTMIRSTYIHTGVSVSRCIAIPLALEIVSGTCSFMSKNTYKQLWTGAVVAAETVKAAFDKYRQRNIEINGEEADFKCMYGEGVEVMEDDGNGNVTKHTEYLPISIINEGNTLWFDDRSGLCVKDSRINQRQLELKENVLNDKYKMQGWINRYAVKKALDLYPIGCVSAAELSADMQIGKIWDDSLTEEQNRLSFGLDSKVNDSVREGHEYVWTITLNMDKNILCEMASSMSIVDVGY